VEGVKRHDYGPGGDPLIPRAHGASRTLNPSLSQRVVSIVARGEGLENPATVSISPISRNRTSRLRALRGVRDLRSSCRVAQASPLVRCHSPILFATFPRAATYDVLSIFGMAVSRVAPTHSVRCSR